MKGFRIWKIIKIDSNSIWDNTELVSRVDKWSLTAMRVPSLILADVCFREFGNHVKLPPSMRLIYSLNDGDIQPDRCSLPGKNCSSGNSSTETYIAGHNLLLAHASASRPYKQKYKDMQGGSVGFSLFAIAFIPSTSSKEDEIAMQRAKDFYFGWMLEPLIYGNYPDEMRRSVGSRLPVLSEEESEQVKGSADFVGIIHYHMTQVLSRVGSEIIGSLSFLAPQFAFI